MLKKIVDLAVRTLGADVVTLYQYVQDDHRFPVEGVGPVTAGEIRCPDDIQGPIYPGDVPWTVVKERKPGFYSRVRDQKFLVGEPPVHPDRLPVARFAEREGIHSMAALLLPCPAVDLKDEEVVGVMFANYRTPHEFNIDEIAALETFADYAAVTILNARHEDRRREEESRAEQLRTLESISASFAHRMSNLAGTSRVATQILREEVHPLSGRAERQLKGIDREANLLLDLATRLSRRFKERDKTTPFDQVDIAKILGDVLSRLEPELSGVVVRQRLAPDLPKVAIDEIELRQLFHDIMSNALEAMKDESEPRLHVSAEFNTTTSRLDVQISDDGPGIQPDVRQKLFSPGVTTKKGKLGIGLWWCRTFIRACGGDLHLKQADPGEGATFVIEMPCVIDEDRPAASELPSKDILVVEDESAWRETLMDCLATEQYTTMTANDYATAVSALRDYQFKLVILDIRLEDADPQNEDGMRLLADIENAGSEAKVIIVTGHGTDEQKQTARRSARVLHVIDKLHFKLEYFQDAVSSVVGRTRTSGDTVSTTAICSGGES